ncbi:hypothetical protein O6H91_12G067100 [Diphasiastrum complanatum]|uniref:Uncharacterized protein n=1 Tax=Diphasiastrum complanatum TaxID=34168 RepID=A0ACC2C307_DIPCM|nr:hypothetical protein O6H91_12G067100 [Diphasiastrum complanatum]
MYVMGVGRPVGKLNVLIMAYDIEIGVWNKVRVQPPRPSIRKKLRCTGEPDLVESKGRLFMTLNSNLPPSLVIWELKIVGLTAESKDLVATIPAKLIDCLFFDVNWKAIWCWQAMGFENSILFAWYPLAERACYIEGTRGLVHDLMESRSLVYDLLEGSWQSWSVGLDDDQLYKFSVASLSLGMGV